MWAGAALSSPVRTTTAVMRTPHIGGCEATHTIHQPRRSINGNCIISAAPIRWLP